MAELSPMMKQYMGIKEQYKDSILFFRLGDFYEMFFEDAKLVSQELDLTLTGKDYGQKERAPMCGIPYHSCEAYIARLVSKGYKVAMCDQIGNPATSKGIVKREVVRVITPGTVVEESMLDEARNNYICSLFVSKSLGNAGISFCDVSTGELKVTQLYGDYNDVIGEIKTELGKFMPKEILVGGNVELLKPLKMFIKEKLSCRIEISNNDLSEADSKKLLSSCFEPKKLEKIQSKDKVSSVRCLGNLFEYIKNTQKIGLHRIGSISFYNKSEYMGLDLNTVRNLEITETLRSKSKKGSLLWVLDKTKTAMGKRMLRSWVERPLVNLDKIHKRQDAVGELVENIILRGDLKNSLCGVHDMERIMTKITYGSAGARDLKLLAATLSKLPEIKFNLYKANSFLLKKMCEKLDLLKETYMLIEDAIVDEPPFSVKEGGIIRDGYNEEIDRLRKDMNGGKETVAQIEQRERERTGIPKLKVGYNRVFGYYIEISNSFKNKVPEDYIRKQTLTNCERYITQELKDLESRILYARDKINETEYRVFESVRMKVAESLPSIVKSATIIANLDVMCSLAEVASVNNYVKPTVDDSGEISIKEGRHPVVEALLQDSVFVPNNVFLDNSENTVAIITGPNMAGKSTYMRQTALMVLLAQIGSFVPASEAKVGIVDSIFTRIGASDDLASGQSTFMIEMNEVAEIIKNATSKSLLILDEIGRGTSTFDGMSIARAVLEYVANSKTLGAKTLFATHYHELTSMADEYSNMKNYSIAVKKNGDDITFLRRIIPSAADESYGIEVAKLAGIPNCVISRAKEILKNIENDKSKISFENINKVKKENNIQLEFKESCLAENEIVEKLKKLDVSVLTPIESMNILYELIKLAGEV